ncbi:methyl-accepting chemotaxis protein [Eubacterium xylanophilum]|uniref:methyl-accepting chemotaxis protein n=1 Tax=Eubacterium xylanophilum TaxID=39497 RepID=UPI00047AB114|nr:methyl-accepting chemotaxis protein [Eubacterium xylanophilum]
MSNKDSEKKSSKKQKKPNRVKQRKRGLSMLKMLLIATLLPLIMSAAVMTFINVRNSNESIEQSVKDKLEIANMQFNRYATDAYIAEGDEAFTKANKDYSYVDSYKENKVEFTIFLGDTRALTSLKDDSGARIEGTKASEKVIEDCLKNGNHFQGSNVKINNKAYYVDYLPLKDANGNIVGMTFCGEADIVVTSAANKTAMSIILTFVAIVAVFSLLMWIIALRIRKPILSISQSLEEIASGNLTAEINVSSSIAESFTMFNSMKNVQRDLNQIISKIRSESSKMSDKIKATESLSQSSSEAAIRISNSMEDLSSGAQSLASNVNDVNDQMKQMGDRVTDIENNIDGLTVNAKNMNNVSKDATHQMNIVMKSSKEAVSAVNSIHDQILLTNDSISKINEAIDLIIEIANQTNLLSLNASIEAARAGEAGRSFAVVADSISNLSEQSNESAATIREIANEILTNSRNSVNLAERIQLAIQNEQDAITSTQDKFTELEGSINTSVSEIKLISDKTRELNKIKEDLLQHIDELSAISEENASSNEEVNASLLNITAGLTEIVDFLSQMDALSNDLEDSVSHFK